MACIAGRLRAARCAAIAAEAPSATAACCLFQTAKAESYPAWFTLPWTVVRSIVTSSARQDAQSATSGDSRRPESKSRHRQRPSDRTEAAAPPSRSANPQPRGHLRGPEQRPRPGGNPHDSDARGKPGDAGRPRWDSGLGISGATATVSRDAGPAPPGAGAFRPASSSHLQTQSQQQQQQQRHLPERWDLVAQNAPRRVLQLIGDPRSGIADDTTSNPFGEVTVDMVHYQPSNEVYWFKYEFAGNQAHGSYRDARLSDYTRNLMYLMRAKDPKRWTIQALADKFRIRKQRVLAILALKELESQRIEDGRLLSGPLSAYALPVYLEDVHLDPITGSPCLAPPRTPPPTTTTQQQQAEVAAEAALAGRQVPNDAAATLTENRSASGGSAGVATATAVAAAATRSLDDHVDVVLPRVVSAAQKLQLQLVELLGQYDYDTARIRTALLADLERAAEMAARVLGVGEGSDGSSYMHNELQSYRTAVEAVVAAVEEVVAGSPLLQEERRVAALRREVEATLAACGEQIPKEKPAAAAADGSAGEGASGLSEGLMAVRQRLAEALQPVMGMQGPDDSGDTGGGGGALQRAFFAFPLKTRGSLLQLLPEVSVRLNAAGVDLNRAAKDAAYRGPIAVAADGGGELSGRHLEADVLMAFLPVSEHCGAALEAALQSLEGARAAVVGKVVALDPSLGAAGETAAAAAAAVAPSASDVQLSRSLVRHYVAADVMWADLLAPSQAVLERRLALPSLDPARKRRMLEVLYEADPGALTRAVQVEAAMQLRFRKAFSEADALAAGVGAAAAAAETTTISARGEEGDHPHPQQQQQQEGDPAGAMAAAAAAQSRPGDRASWDALAAFLEARVAGKVYGSGSGERHVTRLPSYPAFEGYSLEEFDRAGESELSALNRKVSEQLDIEMYERFRKDLLFNLGVRGEKLRLSVHEQGPWPSNLRTELTRPVVVYGIGPDGTTQYPPLYVATGDGKRRPLNEQEKVFQERREVRERLPYYMGRIRRMPELE